MIKWKMEGKTISLNSWIVCQYLMDRWALGRVISQLKMKLLISDKQICFLIQNDLINFR